MQSANLLRYGTFGLVALLLTQTATAAWLDQIFRPAAFEELAAPANAALDSELPPPEPLPPMPTEESVLELPKGGDELPVSPYDQAPYESERPSADIAPLPWQYGAEVWTEPPHPQACCEEPTVKYWNHPLLAKEICSCHNTKEMTVVLTIPTDCCAVEVSVCVTACCNAAPDYESNRDLLGRITHEYCWPCGQRVKVVDRHTGTLVVHTFRRD